MAILRLRWYSFAEHIGRVLRRILWELIAAHVHLFIWFLYLFLAPWSVSRGKCCIYVSLLLFPCLVGGYETCKHTMHKHVSFRLYVRLYIDHLSLHRLPKNQTTIQHVSLWSTECEFMINSLLFLQPTKIPISNTKEEHSRSFSNRSGLLRTIWDIYLHSRRWERRKPIPLYIVNPVSESMYSN